MLCHYTVYGYLHPVFEFGLDLIEIWATPVFDLRAAFFYRKSRRGMAEFFIFFFWHILDVCNTAVILFSIPPSLQFIIPMERNRHNTTIRARAAHLISDHWFSPRHTLPRTACPGYTVDTDTATS